MKLQRAVNWKGHCTRTCGRWKPVSSPPPPPPLCCRGTQNNVTKSRFWRKGIASLCVKQQPRVDKGRGACGQHSRGEEGWNLQSVWSWASVGEYWFPTHLKMAFSRQRLEQRAGKQKQATMNSQKDEIHLLKRPECPRMHRVTRQNGITGHQISATKEHSGSEACTLIQCSAPRGRLIHGVSFPPPCIHLYANLFFTPHAPPLIIK